VRLVDGVVDADEHLDDLVVVVVRRQDQRRDVGRELALLVGAEERVLLRALALLRAGDVVGMFDDDLDELGGALADGVQQRLFHALEADLLHQELDQLHRLAVDGDVQRAAAHVVDAVDVQRQSSVVQRLPDYRHVAERCRVQEDSLLIRQLTSTSASTALLAIHRLVLASVTKTVTF